MECVEAFSVVILSVTTCGVTISNNRTEVMITDDDGEQMFCYAIIIIYVTIRAKTSLVHTSNSVTFMAHKLVRNSIITSYLQSL